MSFVGHRTERVLVELLTKSENSLGYLDGVEGGSLSWNANADLPGGGFLTLEDLNQGINVSQDRIRIWWEIEGVGVWPCGVYVLAAPATQYRSDGSSREIELIDKLTVLRDDKLTETFQLPAGANIVTAAVWLIQETGENRIAFTPSTTTLSNNLTWNPGTSRQQVINDLMAIVGYWSVWTDRNGQFRLEPYQAPGSRPEAWTFEAGETSIHTPEWEYTLPLWEATNTVVYTSQADDDGNFYHASAVDDNPDSPTSTVSMGRVLNPIVEENVEASSQLALQQMANRKLIDNSNVVGRISIAHRFVPVWYNEAVRFRSRGMDIKATITKMSLNLASGSLIDAEWRQAS